MTEERPARVSSITLRLVLPEPLPPKRREALLGVVERCTVHNSLRLAPEVRVTLSAPERAA